MSNMKLPRISATTITIGLALNLAACTVAAQSGAELPELPVFESSSGTLDVTLQTSIQNNVSVGPVMIDGLHTMTVSCTDTGNGCSRSSGTTGVGDYAGVVLKVAPDSELHMSAVNLIDSSAGNAHEGHCMSSSADWDPLAGWSPKDNLFNLHTHGLLTSPYRHDSEENGVVLGDNIFDCARGMNATLRYEMLLGKKPGSDTPIGKTQPAGVNWFHPHVHGIAKAQVSSGMAGMIVVPGEAYTTGDGDAIQWSRERDILLKDMQVVQPDYNGAWLNYADQDPDFCGENKFSVSNQSSCEMDLPDLAEELGASQQPMPGKWLFTLNGAAYPTITVEGSESTDHRELWRVQNASANVTFRLTLRPIGATGGGPVLDAPFEVLSLDGAAAAGPTAGVALAPLSREILLMPGARAELAVGRPDFELAGADPDAELNYQLVNEAFQAGYSPDTADTWPRIALAHVQFKTAPTKLAKTSRVQLKAPVASAPDMKERSRTEPSLMARMAPGAIEGVNGDSEPHYELDRITTLCDDLSQIGFDPSTTLRRIYFAIASGDDAERFLLGETFVNVETGAEFDVNGQPIPADGIVRLKTFDANTGFCAMRSIDETQAETWELVNISAEVHNFHIHQLKFAVSRDSHGNVEMRAPSELDRVNLIDKLILTSGNVELQHDTIIVPRGTDSCGDASITQVSAPSSMPHAVREFEFDRSQQAACTGDGRTNDESGMLRVDLAFAGEQFSAFQEKSEDEYAQPASFVFHCHILEHEDNGMMARMTVLDPAYLP